MEYWTKGVGSVINNDMWSFLTILLSQPVIIYTMCTVRYFFYSVRVSNKIDIDLGELRCAVKLSLQLVLLLTYLSNLRSWFMTSTIQSCFLHYLLLQPGEVEDESRYLLLLFIKSL